MKYQLTWLCANCYKQKCAELGQEIEIKTIRNLFVSLCGCGKLGEHLVDLPVTE
jgi:hypothetical protein